MGLPAVGRGRLTSKQQAVWAKHGFATDAVQWKEAGFTPAVARPWRDAGFTAADAAAWRGAGEPCPILARAAREVCDLATFKAWRSAGFGSAEIGALVPFFSSVSDALAWLPLLRERYDSGLYTVAFWTGVRAGRLTPDDVLRWCRETGLVAALAVPLAAHIDLNTAKRLLARLPAPGPLAKALAAGLSADELLALADDGFEQFEISGWLDTGLPTTRWRELRARGLQPRHIVDLVAAGADDADEMLEWLAQGFSPASAGAYRAAGLTPAEANAYRRSGLQPADLDRLQPPAPPARRGDAPAWTEVFASPRGRAPVYALHRHVAEPDRLWTALRDLGAAQAGWVSMFDPAYLGWAFLDGGFVRKVPHGLYGPEWDWLVGCRALALLCNRAGLELPRTGRHRHVEGPDELEDLWERQRRDASQILQARAERLLVERRRHLDAEAVTSNAEWEAWLGDLHA